MRPHDTEVVRVPWVDRDQGQLLGNGVHFILYVLVYINARDLSE